MRLLTSVTMAVLLLLPCAAAEADQKQPAPPGKTTKAAAAAKKPREVTVDELVREALERNPAAKAAQSSAQAKAAMILPSSTLPDPMFTFQHMGNLFPLTLQEDDPSSARTFTFEQEVPFPGKLALKGKIAEMEAQVGQWSTEQVRRQLAADVKTAFYEYYLASRTIDILAANKELLQQFTEIAEERYRVGEGLQQDVLKAQVEISKLADRLILQDQKRVAAEAAINGLLARAQGTPLGKPAEVKKARLDKSLEELAQQAEASYPALQEKETEIDRSGYGVELARRNFMPDFTLGFTYFDRDMPDMYGVMVKVSVPLYFWRKQELELRSALLSRTSAEQQRDDTLTNLQARLKDSYQVAVSSEKLVDLYSRTVLPQAVLVLESATANYQVGLIDFLTLLDAIVTLLDYQLKTDESLVDYQKAMVMIELYTGLELVR